MSNPERIPWRALIAEGDSAARDVIRAVLDRDEDFEVVADAADAAGAVQSALREKPDVCLVDLAVPGGGLAATWEIAARLPDAKVVVLAQSDDDADLFGALRAGVDGYLLTTMKWDLLPDALDRVCSGTAEDQRALTPQVPHRFRRRDPRSRRPASGEAARRRLTAREREVLDLLAQGWSTAEIAGWLVLSHSAVRVHIASIVRKLGVPGRAAAADLFRRRIDILTACRSGAGKWLPRSSPQRLA